jgi:NagD protein
MTKTSAAGVPATLLRRLRRAKGFVFDQDGTLVLGDRRNHGLKALPGAVRFLQTLAARGIPFVTLTNGTVRTPESYVAELSAAGFPVRPEVVFTPSVVAADYLSRRHHENVMVFGGDGIHLPFRQSGLNTSRPMDGQRVDAVFVGWARDFTMDDLEAACNAVWHGARLYTASTSPFFATAHGRAIGTSRAICAVITSLTGKRPTVLGKPSQHALRFAARRLGVPAADLAIVGDDPVLEPPMARKGGALAIGVQSGLARRADFMRQPTARRAHLVVDDLAELLRLYD